MSQVDSEAAVWRNARSPPLVPPRGRLAGRALSMGPNAVALIVAKVATMGLGFLFWLVAARLFPAHEVGLATAAVSAIMLVTQLALLGVGSAVIALYPAERERPARLLDGAFTLVGGAAFLGGLVFLALSAIFLDNLRVVAAQPLFAVGFVVMSVIGTAGIVLDQTATVLRRGDHVLVRAVLNGVVSLVALVALLLMPGGKNAAWIFATWVVGGAAMCAWGALQLHRQLAGYRPRLRLAGKAAELLRVGAPNHLLTLADRVPGLILPILVTELLSPTANAHWYAVWMMAWVLYIIPIQVGMTLFAEASHRSRPLGVLVGQGVRHALVLGVPAAVPLALFAPQALELLGSGYAAAGAGPLRILVLALVPMTFVQAYYVVCRARRMLREATITAVVSGALAVGGAALVAPDSGLEGVAVAWVFAQAVTSAWAIGRLLTIPREAAADVAPASSGADVAAPSSAADAAVGEPAPLAGAGAAARARARAVDLIPPVALVAGLALWGLSLDRVAPEAMSDAGLISVLPATYFAALAALALGFWRELAATRPRTVLLVLHACALVVVLYATPAIIEEVPRFAAAWRHAGITDYIVQNGSVNPKIDAYFNWPGFFFLSALIQQLAGLHSMIGLARWAPLFFEALYLLPLLVIMRTFTRDQRITWAAVWMFYATNWIGQDYFSPQAASLFSLLVIVAILLRWFPAQRALGALDGRRRAALMGVLITIFAALVPSHQLTPFVALLLVTVLVVFRRSDARGLPLLMGTLVAAWVVFMTVAYLSGHVGKLVGGVGDVNQSVGANVNDHVKGSSEHLFVVYVRLALAAVIWACAALGFVRLWRAGRPPWTCGLLAAAPLALLPMQPYGGEILLRVFLFSLPFSALLVVSAVLPAAGSVPRRGTAAVATLASFVLLGAFLVARYGNERMDAFTKNEITAVDRLYAAAPAGSVLMAGGPNTPWKFEHYGDYRYKVLEAQPGWKGLAPVTAATGGLAPVTAAPGGLADALAAELRREAGRHGDAFFLFARSQEAGLEILGLARPGALGAVIAAVSRSPKFTRVYANRDAQVYRLRPGAGEVGRS